MAIGDRFAKVDGHASTTPNVKDAKPNDGRAQRGREPSGEESNVTENPLAVLQQQRTYRRKNELSRTDPLPRPFRPGKLFAVKIGD
jgi:hypothetical protein